MRTGTSYFPNIEAAEKYYADYEDEPTIVVQVKLEEGLINIGIPPVKPGQKAILDKEEQRYFIEED